MNSMVANLFMFVKECNISHGMKIKPPQNRIYDPGKPVAYSPIERLSVDIKFMK